MRASSTYQSMLDEGRTEGRIQGRLETYKYIIMGLREKRFGKPTAKIRRTLQAIMDVSRLDHLMTQLLDVNSWNELLTS